MTTLYGGVNFNQDQPDQNQLPLMNIAERTADSAELLRRANDAVAAATRVALPAQIISFNAAKQTAAVQPLIREKVVNRQNGQVGFVTLPVLQDVPVCFPQAGSYVLTMPIQAGDEVLLVFSDLNIDSWWQSGGIQNWNDRRRHDLSDAIAVVGLNSVPNAIPNIATDATELRTKDGSAKVSIKQTRVEIGPSEYTNETVTVATSGTEIKLNEEHIEITPDVAVTNRSIEQSVGTAEVNLRSFYQIEGGLPVLKDQVEINGNLIINGRTYTGHTHPVTSAPGVTGPVNPI